jgi:alpha-glucosidase (family GH31 glycosyl hydrolase)
LREPWRFGPEIEAICRKYLRLRYRLLPYIYTAVHQACAEGTPMMRVLVVEFPQDPVVLNISDEYLFGPEVLVAPVMDEGATQRKVYLPAGGWIDFWNEAAYTGPKWKYRRPWTRFHCSFVRAQLSRSDQMYSIPHNAP